MRLAALGLAGCLLALAQSEEYERARELLAGGHAAEAAAIYRNMLRSQPAKADLYLNLSVAEYKAARFREAAASASEALKLAPDLLPANLFLGASYLELGRFEDAAQALGRVVAADPRERNGRLMLAEALAGAGKPKEAIEHFRAAAGLLPANPRVWYGLGMSYEAVGEKAGAEEAWKQLMALPPSVQSHVRSAELLSAASRWQEAASQWKEALRLAPENRKARYGLAWSLFRNRDYSAALDALKPILPSGTADVQFLYGASLLNLQRPSESIPYLRAALAIDSGLLPATAALGQALLQISKPEDAIPLLAASTSIDQDGSIHFQLFRAYQLTKRTAEAQKALAAYQSLRSKLTAR
jgi:predicted Zn-dependent protease